MKKLLATVCILASTLALTACDSTGSGYVDTQPPYASERTVGAAPAVAAAAPAMEAPASAEPVMEKRVTK